MSVTISMEGNVVDLAWVCDQLHGSYWGAWLTDEQILGAIENSLCFWAHHYDGVEAVPVGFCRVVTDGFTFSSVTDLLVAREFQRQGIGTRLLQAALEHPKVSPTVCILSTRDAASFYAKFGFERQLIGVLKRSPQ